MVKLNPRFHYPEVERVTLESGKRYYVCPDTGAHLTSVTTILDATADKSFLKEWEAWVGKEKADRIRKEATDLGSLMHTHVECFVEGVERPRGNNLVRVQAKNMADRIIEEAMPHVDEVWGQEVPLYLPGLYAGTTDLVGIYKGQEAIMDHKTAKKLRKRDQIMDYRDQLAAYAMAHNEKYGTNIQMGVIFMVSRDLKFQAFEFEGDEFREGKASFLDRVERFLAQNAS